MVRQQLYLKGRKPHTFTELADLPERVHIKRRVAPAGAGKRNAFAGFDPLHATHASQGGLQIVVSLIVERKA